MAFLDGILGRRDEELGAPVSGEAIALRDVKDEVFSREILGKGAAVIPDGTWIVAPCAGTVDTVMETGHAVTLRTDGGAQVLIHVGIDTVKLGGKHFHVRCAAGERIRRGQLLIEFDREAIERSGYDTTVMLVVLDADGSVSATAGKYVTEGEAILRLGAR